MRNLYVEFDIAWQIAVTQTLHISTPQNQHGAVNLNLPCESRLHRWSRPHRIIITASNPTTTGPCNEQSDRDAEISPLKQTHCDLAAGIAAKHNITNVHLSELRQATMLVSRRFSIVPAM